MTDTKTVHFLDIISQLDSAVIKSLLISLVGIIAIFVGLFGGNVDLFSAKAGQVIDAIGLLIVFGGNVAAYIYRLTHPNPPLTQMALDSTIAQSNTGALKVVSSPISVPSDPFPSSPSKTG